MSDFEPKWVSPPGATALDLMRERGLDASLLAKEAQRDLHEVSRLLHGLEPLTRHWAQVLSGVLGSTPTFWLRREELYRSDLRRLCGSGEVGIDWLRQLPVRDMIKFGWIDASESDRETVINTCAFLGVASLKAFERKYERLLSGSAYRSSTAFDADTAATAVWLRQGEISAGEIACKAWNAQALRMALDDVRALTLLKHPAEFIPTLEKRLADCGVAVVVARVPHGCRASGATRFLSANKALIQLSFRFLADDQFWFTVFHEIGHLLLHAHDLLFLEGLEDRNSAAEKEADSFAVETLFSRVGVHALDGVAANKFDIARLAKRAGISPGIVVGQLQQRERIPFNHFNGFKVRYTWQD
jgi:HTH-type transcriptional regulator / antitoxin HigA